ncbi:MAG TPA: hypothetical protein VI796_06375 [Candidatus Thermoplasmatota archaeon]|nr:hypothetical protein [Candidatus Thermoplasmatota archaeon]
MRVSLTSVLTALLLAVSGLAVAQEGSDGEGGDDSSPSTTPAPRPSETPPALPPECRETPPGPERDTCLDEYCTDPDDEYEAKCEERKRAREHREECARLHAEAETEDADAQADVRDCPPPPCPSPSPSPSPPRGSEGSGSDQQGPHPACPPPRNSDECREAGGPEDARFCAERFCKEHPEAQGCPRGRPSGDRPGEQHHVRFVGEPKDLLLSNYTVDGVRLLDVLYYTGEIDGEVHVEHRGDSIEVILGDPVPKDQEPKPDLVRIHDNPGGLLTFHGGRDDQGTFTIDLVDGAQVVRRGEGERAGAMVTLPGGQKAYLVAPNAAWDGDTVTTDGFLSIHIAPPQGRGSEPRDRPAGGDAHIEAAIQRGDVGARVDVRRPGARAGVEVESFGDVDVDVHMPRGSAATPDDPVRIEVEAELSTGRTIVLDIDPDLVAGADLELRYFDLNDDGSEQEVVFLKASSLADILDPSDDGGQPEFWVVEDEDGLQVMVSVPHWSAHAITLASVGQALPSVLVGIAAGAVGAILAAVVLLWPRRRRD